MYRSLLLSSLFLIAATASAQTDRARTPTIDGDFGPATLSINYEQRRGDLRRATLTLRSKEAPTRQLDQMAVLSKSGQWITLDNILSSGFGSNAFRATAQAMLPAPDAILIILVKPERGPWRGWKIGHGPEDYTKTEWSYYDGAGNHVRSAPCSARECFRNVVDAFNQAESTASSFQMDLILRADHEEEID